MVASNPSILSPVTNRDVSRAFEALTSKKVPYNTLYKYYDGDQPLTYTNRRLAEIFSNLSARFTQNWTKVVVDSVLDRISLRGFSYPDKAVQALLDEFYFGTNLEIESHDAHEGALVTGEGFLLVWQDPETGEPTIYNNDPRLMTVFTREDNPRVPEFAAKWFTNPDKTVCLYLYYPDRVEYYRTTRKVEEVTSWRSFKPFVPEGADGATPLNPFERVPVFRLMSNARLLSELSNVIPLQNGINKLLSDMIVAAEYGAFKQRYVISGQGIKGLLKNAPNEIWDLPAGDGVGQGTTVGEFAETNLTNYLSAIDNLSKSVSAISRTPKHYFYSESGGDPSGEALITMESPLVKKAKGYISRWTPVWRDAALFALKVKDPSLANLDARKLLPIWDNPETVQPKTTADITKVRVDSGVPLEIALKWEGKTEAEIAEVVKAMESKSQRETADLANALLRSQRNFDQNAGANNIPDSSNRNPRNEDGTPVVNNNGAANN